MNDKGLNPATFSVLPFPQESYWLAWNAAAWRAFGNLEVPGHIISHRSFDHGTMRLPDESAATHAARQDEHRRFDAAERELMELLASGRVKVIGKPPARRDGKQLHHASRTPVAITADTFANRQLAFSPCGGLIDRLPSLERLVGAQNLHGSDADPRFPVYHEVLIEAVALREVWGTETGAPPTRRRVKGFDYRKSDAPLVEQALAGMKSGAFTNATNAARALAKQAEGHGMEESKMKRLLGLIRARSAAERG